MGQRLLLASDSNSGSSATTTQTVISLGTVGTAGDGFIWKVNLSASVDGYSNTADLSMSSDSCVGGVIQSNSDQQVFITGYVTENGVGVVAENTVELAGGTAITLHLSAASGSGTVEWSWTAIGKKVLDTTF